MNRRRSRHVGRTAPILSLLVALVALVAGMVIAAPAGATGSRPYVHANETVPTYSYANAVRESVRVTAGSTTVAVDIVRPREAAQAGVKVPSIMEASPYYSCCGRGNESQLKKYDSAGTITSMPLYYDNYFVPRGYAFVAVDLAGTNKSTGCGDTGGPAEIASAKAVIDWLNGRATAHYLDGSAAVASAWSSGKVGMIGKSWDATIANGVAATGVAGLTTVVPISGISSWYDYMRLDGVPRTDNYPGGLAEEVGGRPAGTCDSQYAQLNTAGDDATGNYNAFWQQRDYVPSAASVHASVLMVHGLNDQNVFARNFSQWWSALAAHNVPRQLWLHQEGHTDPFDINRSAWVTELHQWFDYWLQGINNGVMAQPTVTVERAPNQWQSQADYPAPGAATSTLSLGAGTTGAGTLGSARTPAGATRALTDNTNLTETQAVANPNTLRKDRLAFLSAALPAVTHLSGTPTLTLRVKATKADTELTAKLVDYGSAARDNYLANDLSGIKNLTTRSCWGDSTSADSACYLDTAEVTSTTSYGVLSRGWTDAAHHQSLSTLTPLTPGQWYTVTIRLQPQDQLLAAGHRLGLALSLSDTENTSPNTTGASVTVDLANSSLALPVVGSLSLATPTAAAPHLPTAPTAPAGSTATNREEAARTFH